MTHLMGVDLKQNNDFACTEKETSGLFGDKTENSMHDNTEVCDEHETTHLEPASAIDSEARTMNHAQTQPHSQHAEIKWKRITRPHVNEEKKKY